MGTDIFNPDTKPNKGIKRGDIWYIGLPDEDRVQGSTQSGCRPAIVVSNNSCNTFSSVIEVVYLTTRRKKWLPTHVVIDSAPKRSTALCEQIDSVTIDLFMRREGHCTDREMRRIDKALAVSLGLFA